MTPTHSHVTRILHFAMAVVVVHQLTTSLFMEKPAPGEDAEWPFSAHSWVGMAGLAAMLLFWLWTLLRDRRETPLVRLVPWFSRSALLALAGEIAAMPAAMAKRQFDFPALASAVHGLGLALATFMAATGTIWSYAARGSMGGRLALEAHETCGNIMWAYLIGHTLMATLHSVLGEPILNQMFWPKADARKRTAAPAE